MLSRAAGTAAPDDHFAAGPDRRVRFFLVPGALVVVVGVQLSVVGLYLPPVFKRKKSLSSAPNDHFAAGPDCRVPLAAFGGVGGAGGRPTIRARIVSPAGVQVTPTAVSHPKRSFHCQSKLPCASVGHLGLW